jgi:transcriptional regulator with XRE-family HTH domain
MDFRKLLLSVMTKPGSDSYASMGARSGMNPVYLSQILNGKRPPPSDEILSDACKKLGLSADKTKQLLLAAARDRSAGGAIRFWDEIIEQQEGMIDVDLPAPFRRIPVLAQIPRGSGDNGFFEESVLETVEVTDAVAALNPFAAVVRGDSMTPEINAGTICIFRPVGEDETPNDGAICAVFVEGWSEPAIKQVFHDPAGLVILKSFNPVFPPISVNPGERSVRIIGILIETRRRW